MQEGLARGLLGLPVAVVVVDRRYDIQLLNNAARRLLSLHGVAIGEDLIHLLRGVPAVELRAAIDAAFQPGAPRSEEASTVGTRAANQELATANMDLRSALEEALVRVEETQASAEEVEVLNEELQASNEELETVNEELQATI